MEAAPIALDLAPPPERSNQNYAQRVSGAFRRGYQAQRAGDDAAAADYMTRRPLAANFAQGVGGALPIALTAGAATPEVMSANAGARGLPLFLNQTAKGAATGALYGEVYGIGTSDGSLSDRLQAGNESAPLSAVFGAAAPSVVNTFRAAAAAARPLTSAVGRFVTNAAESIPVVDANSVGMMGRPLRRPPPRPPRPPIEPPALTPATQRRLPQLAERARMSADDVEQALGDAARTPQGQTLVDVFGDAGVRQLRPIVGAPGRTGSLATEVRDNRFQAAAERITASLRRNLGVAETRGAALRRLDGEYRKASAENYQPIWAQRMEPQQRANLEQALSRYRDDPIFQRAVRDAEQIFARDARNGLVAGAIDENFARYAHYLKMGLDDAAQISANPTTSGIGSTQLRGVRDMRRQLIAAIDENIPGYSAARARWGGLREAEEALDEGAQFLRMDSEEVAARMGEMTTFQREHARIGLAHEIQQRIGLAGNTTGNVNVANIQALRSPEMQRRLMAAFETPEQAADFLGTTRTQNQLMRNASAWTGGSPTQGNLAYEADGVAAAMAEIGGEALRSPGHALNAAGRKVANVLFDGAVERSNNQYGQDLLRRVDDPSAQNFTREVVRLLRERESAAYRASQTAQLGARTAGAAGGRRRTQ